LRLHAASAWSTARPAGPVEAGGDRGARVAAARHGAGGWPARGAPGWVTPSPGRFPR